MDLRIGRLKLSDGDENYECAADRISALPDFVICHILSFLPTKSSVATSVLSRRWRFLWTDVPVLDFDDSDYCKSSSSSDVVFYSDIISRVMFLHKAQNLSSFRLHLRSVHRRSEYEIVSWIIAIVARNVQSMELKVCVKLPRRLFTCKTLVHLNLINRGPIPKEVGPVRLPSLKKLQLYFVKFEDDDESLTLPDLLSGCPVLEELEIADDRNLHCIRISSPTIKILTVCYLFDCSSVTTPMDKCKLEINAPALGHLRLINCLSLEISALTRNSLKEAHIHFGTGSIGSDCDYNIALWNFFYNVSHVKCLKLSVACHMEKEIVDKAFTVSKLGSPTMRFGNLTKLGLIGCPVFLTKLLELADNLEVLSFKQCCCGQEIDDKDAKYWRELEQVPRCLSSHIKTIRLIGLEAREHRESAVEMVRFFVRNAKVLEKLEGNTFPMLC